MRQEKVTPQEIRPAVVELMTLPETELMVAAKLIHDLQQPVAAPRPAATAVLAEARRQAAKE